MVAVLADYRINLLRSPRLVAMAGTDKSSAFFPTDVTLLNPTSTTKQRTGRAQHRGTEQYDESLRKHVLYLLKGGGAQEL